MSHHRPSRIVLGASAFLALVATVLTLQDTMRGVVTEHFSVGATPVTLYRPAAGEPGPLVLIAHGFAGSRVLMKPFATTLARNGYRAAAFDFPGHGRNRRPLTGSLTELSGATLTLLANLGEVADAAREREDLAGPYAVLGHSMASDIVVRHAQANPEVRATVAVSLFSPAVTADSPPNLLIINGSLESRLNAAGLEALAPVAARDGVAEALPEVTYGAVEAGSARRLVLADGVEHVGVLFSPESMRETLAWLDASFGRTTPTPPYLDRRGGAVLLLLLSIVVLWWALAPLLPKVSSPPLGAGLRGRRLLLTLTVPALLTPLLLRLLPTNFLPVLVGDYLAIHFGAYGIIATVLARRGAPPPRVGRPGRLALGVVLLLLAAAGLGAALNWQVASFLPTTERLPLLAAIGLGMLPFFLADEWLTRGPDGAWYAYPAAKLAFLLSLGLAVALDFERLFFLLLIVPLIIPFFVVFGLLSRWSYRATGHPWVAGLTNAIVFAWAIAVTFPLVDA